MFVDLLTLDKLGILSESGVKSIYIVITWVTQISQPLQNIRFFYLFASDTVLFKSFSFGDCLVREAVEIQVNGSALNQDGGL